MLTYFFPITFIQFALFFLILSKSKSNYEQLVESYDEKAADQVNNGLRKFGYGLLACSFLLVVGNLIFSNY